MQCRRRIRRGTANDGARGQYNGIETLLDRLHRGDRIGKGDIDTSGLQHGYGGGTALEFADFDVEAFRFEVALTVRDDGAEHF